MMKEHLTFSFIGGDLRQLRVISLLSDEGFHIRVFGFGEEVSGVEKKVYVSKSVSDCIYGADFVVLPLPYSVDKVTVNAPLTIDEVIENVNESMIMFAGKGDKNLKSRCEAANIRIYDYAQREELAVMNAVPTAEGAIETAMVNTPFTIKGSNCLVIGYGRIGKFLAQDLKGLGANVAATSRNKSVLAEIDSAGYFPIPT